VASCLVAVAVSLGCAAEPAPPPAWGQWVWTAEDATVYAGIHARHPDVAAGVLIAELIYAPPMGDTPGGVTTALRLSPGVVDGTAAEQYELTHKNVVEFGMTMQQAVEVPRFASYNFPNSFAPHEYRPGRLGLETDLSPEVFDAMRSRGHDVETWPKWSAVTAAVCAIMRHESGQLHAGADPRREGYALAW
jgi:hypothetical protein